jgi:hypothetical protein
LGGTVAGYTGRNRIRGIREGQGALRPPPPHFGGGQGVGDFILPRCTEAVNSAILSRENGYCERESSARTHSRRTVPSNHFSLPIHFCRDFKG